MIALQDEKAAVIILNGVFYPEMVSSGRLMTELAVDLAAAGHRVTALCSQPVYYGAARVPDRLVYEGVEILRGRTTSHAHRRMASRLRNGFFYSLFVMRQLLCRRGRAVLLVLTTPPFLLWAVWLVSLVRRDYRIAHLVHDLYPDILEAGGRLRRDGPTARIWRRLNEYFYARVHLFITIGRDMQRLLERQTSSCRRAGAEVLYLPNWEPANRMAATEPRDNPLLLDLGLQDRFVVQYSGNLGWCHDAAVFIQAAPLLPEDAHFLFLGGGLRRPELEKGLQGAGNVTFLPFQDDHAAAVSQTACHAAIVSLAHGFAGLVVPCKLVGILASGRPVIGIADEESEIAMVIREENCGVVVAPGDAAALAGAVRMLMNSPDLRLEMGRNALRAWQSLYNREKLTAAYAGLLERLAGDKAPSVEEVRADA